MSYQKSVALLCCLFTFSVISLTGAAHPEIRPASFGAVPTSTVEVSSPEIELSGHLILSTLLVAPPDTTPPVVTITAPADVNLTGCYSDYTYSLGSMGMANVVTFDECGFVNVTDTWTDSHAFCATSDDGSPEGGLVITRTFTVTATDCYGNVTIESVAQSITVTDSGAPTFVEALPNDTTVDCGAIPTAPTLTATDDCDTDVTVTYTEDASTTCAGLIRTWVAVDDCGNTTTHVQTITVTDTENPVITGTPADISQDNDSGSCDAVVTWTPPTASDNCTLDTLYSSHAPGDTFAVGTTTVTYTAEDDCGNTSTTSFTVTISDVDAPSITGTPSDITQTNDAGLCSAVVTWTPPSDSDNCSSTLTSSHNSGDTFPVGSTTVTYTATDPAGNTSSTSFTITVTDDEAPTISGLPANISQTADAGICSAVVNWTAPTSADNCSVSTFTSTHSSGDSFALGTTTVTYTATDIHGNTFNSSFTVTVTDDEDPTITGTPANITQTADADTCGAVVTWTAPTATDNCTLDALTADYNSGDFFPLGTTTVTYTATDSTGNSITSSFTITITDDEVPSISGMPADITQSADADSCNAVVTWTAPTGDDNCTLASLTSTHNSGDTFPVGTTTVTYTATDAAGNTFTSSFSITINDTQNPSISGTPANITQTNDAGNCSAAVSWTAPTAADNCGVASFTSTHSSGDTFAVGTTTVTYTATDNAGNTSTTSFNVTVNDTENPTISGMPADITQTADADTCGALVSWTAPTSSDNCAVSSFTSDAASGDYFAVGTTTVTYTVTDIHGNSATGSFNITVTDDEDPTISGMPADIAQNTDAGVCLAEVTWTAPTADDNCNLQSLTSDHEPGDDFTPGTTTVTYTATDIHGNVTTASFDVTVTDAEAPSISGIPSNISLNAVAAGDSCSAVATWTAPTAADNCGVTSFTSNYSSGDSFGVGTTTVTYVAMDAANNAFTASFTVTVTDNDAPSISGTPGNITQSNDAGVCQAAVTWTAPTVSDNCGATMTSSHDPGDNFPVGTTTVTYTAVDDAANTTTSSFNVTVNDTENPTISGTPADITQSSDAGACSAVVTWTEPTSTDNCAVNTFTSTHSPGDSFPVGTTTVTYTATDIYSNSSTASFTITVNDTEAPTISDMPADITQNTDAGVCTAVVTWTEPNASDNCPDNSVSRLVPAGGVTLTSDIASGSTFGLGTTVVTYTATDSVGNVTTASFTVTVNDVTPPSISGMPTDITQSMDAGSCSATVNWTEPTASDNCTVTSFTSSHSSGSSFTDGTTTVTYTATDASGNTSSASFTVTVSDTENPTISGTPANITQTADAGQCAAAVSWTAPTTSDNCGATLTSTHDPGDTFAVGTTTVTYTSTDAAANTVSTSFNVTVTDAQAPYFTTLMNDTVSTDAGSCDAVVTFADPGAADNCAVASVTSDIASGSTFSLGTTTVTYTAIDIHGNTTSATFDVVVEDNEAPTITAAAQDATTECDGSGNTAELLAWLNNNGGAAATDNCSGVSWSNDFTTMANSCGGSGAVQVIFTATDAAGNTSSTSATFTIVDTTAPSITAAAQDTTTECDGSGNAAQLAAWLANNGGATASESCSSVTWTNNYTSLSDLCGATGAATVIFTATDACGNAASSTATFTITDTTAPTAIAKDYTLTLSASGTATLVADSLDNGSSDGCGSVTLSASQTSFGCADLGDHTITLTVTDDCGNTSTATSTVTVEDNTAPTITVAAADSSVECTGADLTAIFDAWLASNGGASATDACGPLTWSHNSTGLSNGCGGTGSETVTFTVTDGSGNSSSTSATFSIVDTTPPSLASGATNVTIESVCDNNLEGLNAWLLANGGAGLATDACGNVSWSHNFDDFALTCIGTGAVEVTFTASDECGNDTSTVGTFTIVDTTAPVLTANASDTTIECSANTSADVAAWLANHGGAAATEACGNITWTDTYTGLSDLCGNTGTATVTFTATDDCGNLVTSTASVTVEDNTSPIALGQDVTVSLDANGQATITANDIDNGSYDACGNVTLSIDVTSFDCDDVGPNTVTLTVTDECQNASSATVTVTVTAVDDLAPTISDVPADITQNNDAGDCSAVVTYTMPTIADNCAGGSLVTSHPSGSTFPVGATEVTFTATDPSGNDTTATFTVTVLDAEAPTFPSTIDPADENYALGPISNSGASTIQEGWSGGSATYITNDSTDDEEVTDAQANSGSNSWFYTDTYNNPGTGSPHTPDLGYAQADLANQTYTVELYFKAEDLTGDGAIHRIYNGTEAGDDRTGFNLLITNAADGDDGLKVQSYTYSAGTFPLVDIATGLDRSQWHRINITVTYGDLTDPTLDTYEYSIDGGAAVNIPSWVNLWRQDNGFALAYGDRIAFASNGAGPNNSGFYYDDITYGVSGGNSLTIGFETATANPPVADITQTADAGSCSTAVTWTEPTPADNCAVTSLTSTHNSGDTFPVGTTTVTYTATDSTGNATSVSFNVTITDDENPVITGTPADITQTNDAGLCSAVVTWTEPTASDNCAIDTFDSDIAPGATFPVGTTTVTYTATDIHGNVSTSSFDITVTDDEDPAIAGTPADITQTSDAGVCSAAVTWTEPTASDNCAVDTYTSTHSPGDSFAVGTTTVTYTATDIHGNVSTSSFDITVTDDEAPVISGTPADITQTNDAGLCSAVVTWTAPTASDNCAIDTYTSDIAPGSTFFVGTTTVTYTATDIHGNQTTSSFDVTVTDDEAPVISGTPADITQTADAGVCSAVVNWTEPTSADNCGVSTFTSNHGPGATFSVGTTTVTYTCVDIHGNTTTSSFNVTVTDDENPVITAASDLTVECDGAGNLTELNAWLANHGGATATDNCLVDNISNNYDAANMSDGCGLSGAIDVTFTATDIHGNTASTTATFTIEDTTPPLFQPYGASQVVECDGMGNVDEVNAWLQIWNSGYSATDSCGGVYITKTLSLLTDECGATGQASVHFIATDQCSNVTDTTLTFTIEDTMGPDFITTADDLTVECDGAGNTAELQAWLDNHGGATADDVCGDFTWSHDFVDLTDDCGATGSRTVTFTATDECGNESYTSATFTIEDTTAPAIASAAIDMTVECDGAGNTAALNAWLASNGNAGAASDICGGVTWSNDFAGLSDDCGATGTATVTFTATDDCGNTTSTSATFTIEDTVNPAIASEAIDLTVECDGAGNPTDLNAWLAANGNAGVASDACGSVTWSNDFVALSDDCGATGTATVIFTATDECGNTSTTTATFTIEDTTHPSMDVEASDLTVECDGAGNPVELNDWLTSNGGASASDICSGVTWSNDFVALSDLCGATGDVTVTFTATDDCGLSTSTTATFTIEDTTPPVLTGNEVVIIDCSQWTWDPLYQPTIDELLAVQDTAGNPIINLDEACGYTNFPIDFGVMSGGCFYDHQLIYYPIDDCGNVGDSLYQVIQVDDYSDPVFTYVPADTTFACTDDVAAYIELATAVDACDPSVNMTFTDSVSNTACVGGYSIYRTFRAEDCGYNIAFATQVITVVDTVAPGLTLTAPADAALNGCPADMSEANTGSVTWTTTDDCDEVSVSYTTSDSYDFQCTGDDATDEGSFIVTRTFTVTATDCAGNSTTETIDQTITITDDTAPTGTASAPADLSVFLDENCSANPVPHPVSGDASGFLVSATDNCDSDVAHSLTHADDTTYTGAIDGVGSYDVLRTYTVTLVDDCGNASTTTTSHTIHFLDTISPVITLAGIPADIILYADDVNGYFDPSPLGAGVAGTEYEDNCSGFGDYTYGTVGQSVPTGGLIITAIADPNDAASTCRFVEIHNSSDSDIDMTGYALQRWTNNNTGPSLGSNIDLSSIGTLAPGQYVWIANNAGFTGCYGFDATIVAGTGGPADSNGDDNIAIIDGASNIIDMFGVAGEDGSDTCHDFEDGIALRAGSNTDPNGGAWDEAGWIVYTDFSNASGCTNHNSNQPQNAADIAPLLGNWAGAAPPAPQTDFNSVDISYSDETTSYTASGCYTFERTWTITVTDNNGNSTSISDVQTIQVADTSAPDIMAQALDTAACDLFSFDLSAGDQSTLIAGTSFEEAFSGEQYVDGGDASVDHALSNNTGQSDVNFTSTGGEIGFSSYYYNTGSVGMTDGDYVGVTNFSGTVGAYTDGSQGFQFQDTDGIMELVFDNVDVSMGGVTLSLDYFVQSTGWETGDRIRIWVVADGGEVELLDTDYQDIDDLNIEGVWNIASLDLDGYDDAELHVSLESNSGSEGLFIDNVRFTTGNSPLDALLANGYVSFSDNVELASTGASITLDGTPCEGAYDIVYTATDSCGNSSTSIQRIILEDTVDPVLTVSEPADTVIYADANCFADYINGVPYPASSATDNCDMDVAINSYHVDSPKQYHCLPGTGAFTLLRTYTYTATDNCGNTHTIQVNRLVTVLDTISPTFNAAAPADLTVNIDPFCGANTSTTIGGMPTVTDVDDNCDSNVAVETTYTDSAPVYTCSDADGNAQGSYTFVRTFTVTATDDCGNATSMTLTQNITALDVNAPTITALPPMAPENFTLDGDCYADLTPTANPFASAVDACDSEVSITSTYSDSAPVYTCQTDSDPEGSYTFTRTWTVTATDDCGNSVSQQTNQTVNVSDSGAPTMAATWPADYSADLDADCDADLTTAAAGVATATADDACDSDVDVAISYADHDTTYLAVNADDIAEGSFTFTRTWTVTATDDCGNITSETHDQTITAHDVMAPTQTLETLPTYTVEGCYGEVNLSPSVTGTPEVTAEDACDSDVDISLTYSTDDMIFNELVGNYNLVIDTISGPEDGVIGMTTVRLYIETENADDFISAVAGDEINPTGIRTTTSFYQNALGGTTANSYNPLLTAADPLVAYDSFVTIGIDEAADGAAGEVETTVVGSWAASFEAGGDLLINDFFGGSWFTTYPNTAAVAGADNRVLIGQFTTDGQMSGQLFVQVFPNGLGANEMRLSFTFGDCAEDDDTPEGSYTFTRHWQSVVTDDMDNSDTVSTYQHIMVLDTEAPQLTNTCGINNGETVDYDCPGIGVLDFDPVPVPCFVTAIDNCDSEVNVTQFIQTTGYIPTNDIRNYCAPTTPDALNGAQTCDDRAPEVIRLFNFPGADDSFVMADAENLVQVMSDGSMHIELEVENADGTGGFIFTADYGVGQDWATWQAGGSNYKKDCAEIYPGESVWQDWIYFMMSSGSLEGTGMYAGSSFSLSHQPANGYYGMQMGLGANNKNANYGGSAWFFWQGNLVVNGTNMGPMASSGDVYMDLDCCLEWQVDYFYTAFDDCGNTTGFSYSDAMGGETGAGDASASGGHIGGPIDITSVGGIKEPIRITGLSPNPTTNQSQLTFLVNENMRLRVDLYTSNGVLIQELYDGNAVTGVQYTMNIDVDNLAAGMYQVRISSSTYIAVKKLLVAQ